MRQNAAAVCSLGNELQAGCVNGDVYLLRRSAEQPPAVLEFREAMRQRARTRVY